MPANPPTATSGKGHPPYEEEFRTVGQILERDAKQIMERWFERASEEQVHADSDQRSDVMDELLRMLQSLGQRLQDQDHTALEEASEIAREHGQQRSGLGWDVVELVQDYEILHGVALEHLGEVLNERLTYRQAMVIATVVDRATGSAVKAFSELAQQRLEQRANQLQQLMRELTQTEQRERRRLAQLLHDNLQQLLVAIIGIQAAGLQSDVAQPRGLERVEHIQSLIDEASEVSRSLTGQLSPPLLFEVGLVAAVHWLGRQMSTNHQLTVYVEGDEGITVPDEPTRVTLFEGVRELLLNVAKHAQVKEAWVRLEQTEQQVRVTVEDHGLGYNADDATEPDPGTFGLPNVRERMEWLQGTMQVESTPGEGTRAIMAVPRHPAQQRGAGGSDAAGASIAARERPVKVDAAPLKGSRRLRVLVADDHRVVREGLVRMISESPGFEVVAEAGDGVEAVELAHQIRPHVIVMDVTMPRMDGVEATRRIANELPDVRVIGLSVHAEEDMAEKMRDAGADAYLSKTGPIEELLAALRNGSPT